MSSLKYFVFDELFRLAQNTPGDNKPQFHLDPPKDSI